MSVLRLKIALCSAVLMLAPAALLAQDPMSGDPANNQSPVQNASTQSGVPRTQQPGYTQDSTGGSTDPQSMRDRQFVHRVSEAGLAQIELAKLALTRSSNDGVKALAKKIIDDHSTLDSEMKAAADSLGISSPRHVNKMSQTEHDKLNTLSSPDFDKEYVAFVVGSHRRDLHEFHQELLSVTDPSLKDATLNGAKVIHEHLTLAEKLATENGVVIPEHEHAAAGEVAARN